MGVHQPANDTWIWRRIDSPITGRFPKGQPRASLLREKADGALQALSVQRMNAGHAAANPSSEALA